MGPTLSKSEIETISNTVNKTTIEILNKNENDARQTATTTQTMTLDGINLSGCELEVSQLSSATLSTMQSITASTSADLIAKITSALQASATSEVKAKSETGSQPANAEAVTRAITSVENEMKANLTMDNINTMIQTVNQNQTLDVKDLTYDLCKSEQKMKFLKSVDPQTAKEILDGIKECENKNPLPKCNLSQITTANLVAEQITTSVMDIIANNEAVSSAVTNFKSKTDAEGAGIGSMIGDIFKGLFSGLLGPFAALGGPVLASCCLCCCILLVLMVAGGMMPKGGGGGAPANVPVAMNNGGGGGYANGGGLR
jgi:hypothetical protein